MQQHNQPLREQKTDNYEEDGYPSAQHAMAIPYNDFIDRPP
jgi:hypothetical protein